MTEPLSVTRFREYLRIETVQPDPDYHGAKIFLENYAKEIGLEIDHCSTVPGKKWVHIMTLKGTDSSKKSILLNSHIDVVPVYPEYWKHPPFSANKEANGDIYARGSQDMKLVGIQYMEAIRELLATGWKPKRDIHISWVPDEEIGGHEGVELMLKDHRAWFDKFNIGFELDEGLANPEATYRVFYSERSPFWIKAKAVGTPGHGSAFIKDTASERLHKFNSKVFEFRREQENLLESNKDFTIGDVTTVNWTSTTGGVQPNVVPAEMEAVYDFRVTPTLKAEKFMDMVENWARDIGGIEIEYLQKTLFQGMTEKDDEYWQVMKKCFERIGIPYKMEIFPAATDARYLREYGLPCIGFSPMIHEEVLLHDHNEKLNEKTFLRGVEIYKELIKDLADF